MYGKVTRESIIVAVFLGLWQLGRAGEPALHGQVSPTSPTFHAMRPSTETIMLMHKIHALEMQLMASREALTDDPEIIALSKAAGDAEQALSQKTKELVDDSTETVRLRGEMDALRGQMTSQALAVEKKREAARRYHELLVKIHSIEERVSTGTEIVALASAVQKARTALEQKVAEKLKANPKTAPLVKEREQLQKKLEALMKDIPKPEGRIPLPVRLPSFGAPPVATPKPQTSSSEKDSTSKAER